MANTVFETAPRPGQSCIDTSVVEQLKTRQKLVSKKYEDLNFTQSFLTSNYAWLRMVSGINIKGIPNAAKKHQLLGGTLYDSKKRKGFNFSNSYLNDTTGAAYTNEKEGIKPMPGIVGFSVDQMGDEGLLRQINIQVQCHSLEQFSILEKLYMRPGYYSFIEWGHSVYVDKSGASITNPKMLDDSIIFAENVDPDEIKKAASKLVYDSQNNYDYIIAQIMNYEWSYNNGVYELDIQLIGQGGLSEMYKRMFDLGTDKEKSPEPEKDKKLEFSSADLLAGTFGTIMKIITETSNRGRESEEPLTPGEQLLELYFEKKGRGGKQVVIIKGFDGGEDSLKELGKKLKQHCGVGGSSKDGEIILQGNVRERATDFLKKEGYKTKRIGG